MQHTRYAKNIKSILYTYINILNTFSNFEETSK